MLLTLSSSPFDGGGRVGVKNLAISNPYPIPPAKRGEFMERRP